MRTRNALAPVDNPPLRPHTLVSGQDGSGHDPQPLPAGLPSSSWQFSQLQHAQPNHDQWLSAEPLQVQSPNVPLPYDQFPSARLSSTNSSPGHGHASPGEYLLSNSYANLPWWEQLDSGSNTDGFDFEHLDMMSYLWSNVDLPSPSADCILTHAPGGDDDTLLPKEAFENFMTTHRQQPMAHTYSLITSGPATRQKSTSCTHAPETSSPVSATLSRSVSIPADRRLGPCGPTTSDWRPVHEPQGSPKCALGFTDFAALSGASPKLGQMGIGLLNPLPHMPVDHNFDYYEPSRGTYQVGPSWLASLDAVTDKNVEVIA
ncbi:hypothetical protein K470DRAFT_91304 [Piedraia hortae CBS 480.64]|uniref:Uncharacterized protein n=1 Tax=Piedraia hortae CBS 480.64 TaxID=1314780 RepID=A0A6A7BXX0_9PEZI|nr:hypothetical protein K470DRAFT_91304 [Piedraia hortae CBS 480.64]